MDKVKTEENKKWQKELKDLQKSNTQDFIFKLQMKADNFNGLINEVTCEDLNFPLLVRLMARLCSDEVQQVFEFNAITLIDKLVGTAFHKQLSNYMLIQVNKLTDIDVKSLLDVAVIIDKIFNHFPAHISRMYQQTALLAIQVFERLRKVSNTKGCAYAINMLNRTISNKLIVKYGSGGLTRAEVLDITAPENHFRHVPVTICQADVHQKIDPILYPNIVRGRYDSVEHFMEVQYRLFREDFIGPLREVIKEYISQVSSNTLYVKIPGVNIYHSVRIESSCIERFNGVVYRLTFNLANLVGVNWHNTKRLLYGTLLCLSCDNFAHFMLATVFHSRPEDLKRGFVNVKFLDFNNFDGFAKTYVMIESPSYFEAYAPVLRGLKETDEFTLPFKNVLVEASNVVKPPKYLNRKTVFKTRLANNSDHKWFPLSDSWPSAEDLVLDESQLRAMKMALTQEIAIIQGPPATGKTYVSLKVAKMLIENNCGKILVICFTNHALDQFLEGILDFCPKGIIRVGGQSKSELLSKFNLRNIRKKFTPKDHRQVQRLTRATKRRTRKIKADMERYQKFLNSDFDNNIIPDWLLFELDVISQNHRMQLEEAMIHSNSGSNNSFEVWLEAENYRLIKCAPGEINTSKILPEKNIINAPTSIKNVAESNVNDALAYEERAHRLQSDENERALNYLEVEIDNYKNSYLFDKKRLDTADLKKLNLISEDDRRDIRKLVQKELRRKHYSYEKEVQLIENIWDLKISSRWNLYRYWLTKAKNKVKTFLSQMQTRSDKLWDASFEFRQECLLHCLGQAQVIGMTTSGAARYRRNLQRLQPPIIIVEEAAEVLEAHVITALNPGCQHLILIGDQQQLRPKTKVYELEKDYKLDVSLFERLINNDYPYQRLQLQHRMRPTISMLITPNIYPDLLDHEIVQRYENVAGMMTNVFFLDHKNEESNVTDSKSKSNFFEAEMLLGLCDYLLKQGYEPPQITILTGYLGQVALIAPNLPEGVRCASIDGYQGEENDIILLSLVRSNSKGSVGFLNVANRVCVALSRAKKGLYCVGNFDMVTDKTEVWKPIVEKLQQHKLIGPAFNLVCQNHPQTVTEIYTPEDFLKVSYGGCSLPCTSILRCGHQCQLLCHVLDAEHEYIECEALCFKPICELGHRCHKKCYELCGICEAPVLKLFSCGHENIVPCNVTPSDVNCPTLIIYQLPCGHSPVIPCSEDVRNFECQEEVERQLSCGHQIYLPCSADYLNVTCSVPVNLTLKCGHDQMVPCGKDPERFQCQEKCDRRLKCGHQTVTRCGASLDNVLCLEKCLKILKCGHQCQLPCSVGCDFTRCRCDVEVNSPCGHKVTTPCNDRTKAKEYCTTPCSVKLPCGHVCKGTCSSCYQGRIHVACTEKCDRILLNGELCKNICSKPCCNARPVNTFRCGHNITSSKTKCQQNCEWQCQHKSCSKKCHEICDRKACDEPCPMQLPCGHSCVGYCGDPCPKLCRVCSKNKFIKNFVFGYKKNNKNSRYILLEDCQHIIERSVMDKWIGNKAKNRETFIGAKNCPKCNHVISFNFRYGNVIKTSKDDQIAVRSKILDVLMKFKERTRLILTTITDRQTKLNKTLPDIWRCLPALLQNEDLNTFDVIFLSNLDSFIQKMLLILRNIDDMTSNIKKELMKNNVDMKSYNTSFQRIEAVEKHFRDFETMIVAIVNHGSASNAMWLDLSRDLMRIEYLQTITAHVIENSSKNAQCYLKIIEILKRTSTPFNAKEEENIKKLIHEAETKENVKVNINVNSTYFTFIPRFSKGSWLKCVNGHIYTNEFSNKSRTCGQCRH